MKGDKRRLCLYLPAQLVGAVEAEAVRLDRPQSWIVQHALRNHGLRSVAEIPSLVSAP